VISYKAIELQIFFTVAKPLVRWKNLRDISYIMPSNSPFCPKIRCHGNGGRLGENAIGSIQWPITETPPPTGVKISQMSYTSRVIANFVPNFVAMATREVWGKIE